MLYLLADVNIGHCTPQLQRKKPFGGYYADANCAFSIDGRYVDHTTRTVATMNPAAVYSERTVDLETKTPAERCVLWQPSAASMAMRLRDAWVNAINTLIQFIKTKKKLAASFNQ